MILDASRDHFFILPRHVIDLKENVNVSVSYSDDIHNHYLGI